MAFLRFLDYKKQIQEDNLLQIIEDDLDLLTQAEEAAIAEIKSYLVQRYDTTKIFSPVQIYSSASTYTFGDRVAETSASTIYSATYLNSSGETESFFGFPLTASTYWTSGDTRNQYLLQLTVDVVLYHLHSRINPRYIPELRSIRYDGGNALQTGGAIGWLKKVAGGDLTADFPELVPAQGRAIRWGYNDLKDSNTY